jgi:transcriptional regulator with XRE-family HTH domain
VTYARGVKENTKTIIDRVGGPTIGARIRRLRLQMKMSIRDLAEKASISKNSLLRVEQGLSTHAATVLKICEVLGLHIESLAEETDSQPPLAAVHRLEDDRWYDMVNFGAGTLGGHNRPLSDEEVAKYGKSGKVPLNRITARLPGGRVFPTMIELHADSPVRSHALAVVPSSLSMGKTMNFRRVRASRFGVQKITRIAQQILTCPLGYFR